MTSWCYPTAVDDLEERYLTHSQAPHETVVGRLDEALAARKPNLRWQPAEQPAQEPARV